MLSELALLGRVELDEDSGGPLNGPVVRPAGEGALPDPLLESAHGAVAERPRRVQPLLPALGGELRGVLLDRLEQRGLVRRETHRRLGVFRTTTWPAADERHEAELRRRIRAALQDGDEPDARTAAVISLLYGSGAMPALRPPMPWNSTTVRRARELQSGNWGGEAVGTAVARTTAAIAAATATAATTAAITTT